MSERIDLEGVRPGERNVIITTMMLMVNRIVRAPIGRRWGRWCARGDVNSDFHRSFARPFARRDMRFTRCAALVSSTLIAHASITGSALAQETGPTDRSRWEPTASLSLALSVNDHSGEGDSTVRPPISGSTTTVSPGFGLGLGVNTPAASRLPMAPRFFVSGALIPTVAFARDTAKEGSPSGMTLPPQEDAGLAYTEQAIDGQGSVISGRIKPLVWSMDAGFEVEREIGEKTVFLRPSFSWTYFEVDTEARVLRAFKPNLAPEPGFPRLVTLEDASSRPYHGVGGGLEIGIDMRRRGRLRPAVFFSTHFYNVLGDRTIGMADTFTDASGTERARWEYGVDSFLYRLQMGIRIGWAGRD